MCEDRIKVASYTGFRLKCRIADSTQLHVKLAVGSNTAQF